MKQINILINSFRSAKKNPISEADIKTNLAWIYLETGRLDETEDYFRQAYSLEPENPIKINNLAYFLVDRDRNIDEGMELIDNALRNDPYSYYMLDTKGWALFKQGKYQEAFDILQKSWDLKREKAVYDHEAFLHLEAATKAAANQENY